MEPWARLRCRLFCKSIPPDEEGEIMSEEQKPQQSEILDELDSLGKQLALAVKTLWESEDSRNLRQELRQGFAELGRQLDTAVKSAQESEAAQEFSEQVKETMDKARQTDLAGKLEQGLVTGLRDLNREISELVSSMEKDTAEPGPEPKAEE
jgi:hypothetical protein